MRKSTLLLMAMLALSSTVFAACAGDPGDTTTDEGEAGSDAANDSPHSGG